MSLLLAIGGGGGGTIVEATLNASGSGQLAIVGRSIRAATFSASGIGTITLTGASRRSSTLAAGGTSTVALSGAAVKAALFSASGTSWAFFDSEVPVPPPEPDIAPGGGMFPGKEIDFTLGDRIRRDDEEAMALITAMILTTLDQL